ncbi:unnamed protein product, partial [Brenthis ino]
MEEGRKRSERERDSGDGGDDHGGGGDVNGELHCALNGTKSLSKRHHRAISERVSVIWWQALPRPYK